MSLKLIILSSLLLSCASSKPTYYSVQLSQEKQDNLESKSELYLDLNGSGWIKDTKCDGLLFNSLYALAGGDADPMLAQGELGKFFRSITHDCYANKQSRSETSRDMYVGLMLWAQANERLDILNNIVKYGRKHSVAGIWIMGKEKTLIGSVDFRPDFLGTVFQVRYDLGGADEFYRWNIQSYKDCSGYVCHIKALLIFLRYRAGMYNEKAKKLLKKIADKNHNNALTNAIYGVIENDMFYIDNAYRTLMNEKLFPKDRLPTNHDRCGFYIFERSKSSDSWKPCKSEPKKVWSGVDFLFSAAILTHNF